MQNSDTMIFPSLTICRHYARLNTSGPFTLPHISDITDLVHENSIYLGENNSTTIVATEDRDKIKIIICLSEIIY